DLRNGGDDGMRFSFGIRGQEGKINAPTVYNSVFNFRQFWDGHAKNLEEQVYGPVNNPVEMGNDMHEVVEKLKKDDTYVRIFSEIYPDGITEKNIANAIAEYEKELITPNAPFDYYLRGDKNAISERAKKGYALFKYKGCIICHNGVNVGGNLFNWFGIYTDANSTNLGRYNVTKREEDKYVFKVPSLRNVALTAPYMHDGRFKTLREAVKFMSQAQLGRFMTEDELDAIVAFLESLTGELPLERRTN
ncbi:MAG: c-type cytochrome, partial [Sulfurovum sp.]|nr:c-type cytochrome [Sulfurovum sp.]